ncbi:MAG: hypothetical protein ABWY04_21095 [Arthrobacter sp.]
MSNTSATTGSHNGSKSNKKLTEIRVHGVGGTPPDYLLDDIKPRKVAGDRIAGFFRTTDLEGRQREAYSWGGLTSHSPFRVLWILLMPSMLANMAGWMARRYVTSGAAEEGKEPSTRMFRWFARTAALALTLSTSIMVSVLSLDTLAYQCLGQLQCRNELWGTSLLNLLPSDRPGIRLLAGAVIPTAIAVFFYFLARHSRNSYERVEPPSPGAVPPTPSDICAAAQPGGLRSADFWSGRLWHQHLSNLHLAAGIAVTTGMLGLCWPGARDGVGLTAGLAAEAWMVSIAALALVVGIAVFLRWDKAYPRLAALTLWLSGLLLLFLAGLIFVEEANTAGGAAPAATQTPGVLPGVVDAATAGWLLILLLLLPLCFQQVAAWASRWRQALGDVKPVTFGSVRAKANGPVKTFPFAAPVVLNVVALVLANTVLLSLLLVVAEGLGEVKYDDGGGNSGQAAAAGGNAGPDLWVPQPILSVTAALSVGLVSVLILFGVYLWLFLSVQSRRQAPGHLLKLKEAFSYVEPAAPPPTVPFNGKRKELWQVSALDTEPFANDLRRDQSQPTKWVRKATMMRLLGERSPDFAAQLMLLIAGVGVLSAVFPIIGNWSPPTLLVDVVKWLSVLLPVLYASVARLMFRQERFRKALLTPFDVGTFFPRSFHPFAPPSYTERAVPELTRRIWWLHDHEGPVVLTAHSQGSAVAAAVLARIIPPTTAGSRAAPEKTVGLVTLGCPLAKLYRWAFPALFSDGLLQGMAEGRVGFGEIRWRNVYYDTDYIGGSVQRKEWAKEIDKCLIDPATDKFDFGQPVPRVLSHTGYWFDDRFWKEVDTMCTHIASLDGITAPATLQRSHPFTVVALNGGRRRPKAQRMADPTLPVPYR